jgi:hypothetical protein
MGKKGDNNKLNLWKRTKSYNLLKTLLPQYDLYKSYWGSRRLTQKKDIEMNIGNATNTSPTIEDFIQWLDDVYDKERKQIFEEAKGLSDEELHQTKLFDDNNELNKSYKLIRGAAEKLKQFENEWGKDEEKKDKLVTLKKGILSKIKIEDTEDPNSEEDGKDETTTSENEWDPLENGMWDPIGAELDRLANLDSNLMCGNRKCVCWDNLNDCPNQIDDFYVDEMEVLEDYKEEEQSISKTDL